MSGDKWCLGHGVVGQAESLRAGHKVPGFLVADVFSTSHAAGRSGARTSGAHTLQPRCVVCRSIRAHHDQKESIRKRVARFRREHAARWVSLGRRACVGDALDEMDTGGITPDVLERMFQDAVGRECPGRCLFEEDGVLRTHLMDRVQNMEMDVLDPAAPFTLENIAVMCLPCNRSKREVPFGDFIWTRRASERMWQLAIDDPSYRRPEQLGLFDDVA